MDQTDPFGEERITPTSESPSLQTWTNPSKTLSTGLGSLECPGMMLGFRSLVNLPEISAGTLSRDGIC